MTDRSSQHARGDHHRAGLVSRTVADIIDLVVVAGACLLTFSLIAAARYVTADAPWSLPTMPGWLVASLVSVLVAGYLAAGWITTGRTVGKQVLGLRVVSADGARITPGRAIIRAVLCIVFPVGILWVAVSASNLSLHDILVRSRVIYDWPYHAADIARP